jgi:hypothetical protein
VGTDRCVCGWVGDWGTGGEPVGAGMEGRVQGGLSGAGQLQGCLAPQVLGTACRQVIGSHLASGVVGVAVEGAHMLAHVAEGAKALQRAGACVEHLLPQAQGLSGGAGRSGWGGACVGVVLCGHGDVTQWWRRRRGSGTGGLCSPAGRRFKRATTASDNSNSNVNSAFCLKVAVDGTARRGSRSYDLAGHWSPR